ncbi:MAG: hypothetical protein ACO3OO_02425, partial [Gemmobacter sp.]
PSLGPDLDKLLDRLRREALASTDEAEALAEGLRRVAGDEAHPQARAARALLYRIATLLPQAGIEPGPRG